MIISLRHLVYVVVLIRLWPVCSHMVPQLEPSLGSSGSRLVDLGNLR